MKITLHQFEIVEALVPYLKKRGVRLKSEKVGEISLEYQIQDGEKWVTKHAPIWDDSQITIDFDT
jgi:urease gamma subunit